MPAINAPDAKDIKTLVSIATSSPFIVVICVEACFVLIPNDLLIFSFIGAFLYTGFALFNNERVDCLQESFQGSGF
jgi:hypothetical protein